MNQNQWCSAPETFAAWSAFERGGEIVDLLKHAIRMEAERDSIKAEAFKYVRLWDKATKELESLKFGADSINCDRTVGALGCPCEMENSQERAMERIRDLIAMEGELGDLKEFIREKVLIEVYNQYGQNNALIASLKSKCAVAEAADKKP